LALRFGAELKDRNHHQRALHAHHGAVAAVHALHLAGNQAVGHVIQARATIGLWNGRAQQAEFTHLAEDGRVGTAFAECLGDAGQQLVLAVGSGGIAHHAFVVAQLGVEQKGVLPVECSGHGRLRKS